MTIEVACDTCEFAEMVDEEWRAEDRAKRHEGDQPTHTVLIKRLE